MVVGRRYMYVPNDPKVLSVPNPLHACVIFWPLAFPLYTFDHFRVNNVSKSLYIIVGRLLSKYPDKFSICRLRKHERVSQV